MSDTPDFPDEPGPQRRSLRVPLIVAAATVLAGVGGYLLFFRQKPPPPPPPQAAAPAPPPAAPAPEPTPPPAPPGPTGERGLLEAISSNRIYRQCIAREEPVRLWAAVADNVAQGSISRKNFACLAPGRPFAVTSKGGRTVIAAASYRRYDALAAAVSSIDAQAVGRAWRALHPALEAAYRALGYPDGSVDRAAARALSRVVAAPVVDRDVPVVEGEGTLWLFADRKLEALGEVEKHLLRMGPRNTRAIQAKAREVQEAIGLPAAGR